MDDRIHKVLQSTVYRVFREKGRQNSDGFAEESPTDGEGDPIEG